MLGNGSLKNKIDSSKDNLSRTEKKSRVKNGISLVVLVITIIVIIIISATVIMGLNKNDGISNSSKAALKTDMQAMLDKQLVTYQEALYSVDGDSSKLDNSAFSDVVPEKYKEEFEATKGGVIYKGENEKVKEIAKEVGIIVVDNKTVAEGIDNLEVETTTNSIQVSVTASNEYGKVESLKYYYSKDNGASWQSKESNRLVETLDKLSQNTGYKIKVEAKSESGNTLTSKEMDVKTKALEIGKIELREEDASGKEYVSGNWTNKGIYIGIVSKNTKSESTTYEVTGANEVTSREESTVINKAGTSKVIVKTTDGINTESKEYEVKIDNVAPNGSYSKVVGTNDIKVSVQNASDDLSGIEGYSYYIDDILKSTSTTKTYTYTGLNTAEKHIIKVVIKDKAGNEKEIEEQVAAEEVPSAEGNVEYVISPSGATTGNVKVTIKYKQIEGMTGEFSTDGYTYTQVGSTYEYTTNKNMTVYVRYKDSKGQTGVRKEIVIDNIVKSKPLISIEPNGGKYVIPEGKNVAKIKAKVTITDSGDSKIKQDSLEYVWTKSQEAPNSGYSKFTNMQTVEKSDASKGTWYLYIKAENEAGSKTIEKSNGYVIGSASEEDNGIQVLVSPRGYTNKDVIVTIKYGRSLTKELKAGYGDNIQAAIKDANETKSNGFTVGKNGYIYVSGKDEAGNEVTKTVNVNNIDKEAPKIEISTKTATNVKSIDVTIKVSDSGVSGLSPNNVYEYALGKSNKEAPNGVWNKYTSGSSIKIGEGLDGKYYLWVREVADRATNVSEDGEKVGKNNVIGEYEFKNNVEVKFDANGGETPDPSEKYVANGSMYGKLATTKREGYTFSGWYTEKQNGIKIEETTILNNKGDHTLYAHWQANSYTVNFDKNGGETPNPVSKQVRYDDNYGELATTKREYTINYVYNGATGGNTKQSELVKYTFNGWYKDEEHTQKIESTTKMTTASNHTLYAGWSDGSTTLPTPIKSGYNIEGWYEDQGLTKRVGGAGEKYVPTANVTLYAKYYSSGYIVTFDSNGGDKVTPATKNVEYNFKYGELPTPGKRFTVYFNPNYVGEATKQAISEFTFNGWYLDKNFTNKIDSNSTVSIAANHTLYASWLGGEIRLLDMKRDGYTLDGWYKERNLVTRVGAKDDPYTPTATTTLYAKWTKNNIKVSFNPTGGDKTNPEEKNVKYQESYGELPTTKKEFTVTYEYNGATGGNDRKSDKVSYSFQGWYTGLDYTQIVTSDTIVTRVIDHTLYAKWADNKVAGGLPSPTKSGTKFLGWYADSGFITKVGDAGSDYTPTTNITLYAKWETNGYTVSFDSNGGEKAEPASKVIKAGENYGKLPVVSRAYRVTYNDNYTNGKVKINTLSYTFNGWYTEKQNGTKIEPTSVLTILKDHTLYARWTTNSIPPEDRTRTGYIFGGWYKESSCINQVLKVGQSYIPASDITLYAKWTPITYEIKYNGNGATSGSMVNSKHTYDVAKALTKNAYAKNHTVTFNYNGATGGNAEKTRNKNFSFNSWNSIANGGGNRYTDGQSVVNLSSTQGAIVNLYAQWNIPTYGELPKPTKNYTVTYNHNYTGSTDTTAISTYVFGGWFKEPGLTNVVNSATQVPTNNHTLHAKWSGGSIVLETPVRTGYIFGGWYKEANCINKVGNAGESFTPTTSYITLYAKWTPITYQIKYNGNGATSGSMANSPHTYDVAKALTKNAYAKNHTVTFNYNGATGGNTPASKNINFSFNSWTTQSNGTGNKYTDGESVVNLSSTQGAIVNLYAQWNSNTYGNLPSPTKLYTVTYNHNYTGSSNTTANSTYTFGGWYKENTYANKVESTTQAPMNNHTIYAKWNNGAISGGLETPTRTGYTFGGWYKEAACTNKVGDAGASYTPTSTITLYAKWIANTYQIKYDGNGATSGSMANSTHTYDVAKALTKNAYSKTGYTFVGWNRSNTATTAQYTDAQSVSNLATGGTVTLYAIWKKTVTITYDLNGCTGPIPPPQSSTIYNNQVASIKITSIKPTPVTGYKFLGWDKNKYAKTATYQSGSTYQFTDSTTLYAISDKDNFILTFDANGGTVSPASISAKYDSTIGPLPTPTWTGHTFTGWYTASSGGTVRNYTKMPAYNETLYAHWNVNTYQIKYDGNGATSGSMSNSTGIKWNSTVSLTKNAYAKNHTVTFNYNGATGGNTPASKNINFSFNSWNSAANGSGSKYVDGAQVRNLTSTNGATYTIYAQWNSNTYGELPNPTRAYTVTYSDDKSTATATYTFNGWYNGSTKVTSTTDAPKSNHTLTASWTPKYVTLPNRTKTGYTFGGWYKEADLKNKVGDANTPFTPTYSITLYPKWINNTYTVTYNANGGSGTMTADTATYGQNYKTRANGFIAPTGKKFAGWNEKSDGTGTSWTNYIGVNWVWNYTTNVTLYAQWTDITTTVTFMKNTSDTDTTSSTQTYTYNASGTAGHFSNRGWSRTGYTLKGWNEDRSAKDAHYSVDNVVLSTWVSDMAPSIKLYAIWEPVTLKVTFMRNLSDTDTLSNSQTFTYKDSGSCGSFSNKGWSKTGYTLSGWTEHRGSTDVMYSTLSGVNNNWLAGKAPSVTLYAVWKPNQYTVKVDPNGGNFNVTDTSITKNYDGTATFKTTYNKTDYYALGITASRSGYTFDGFYTEKNGGVKVYDSNGVSVNGTYWNASNRWIYTGNVTLYAHWIANSVKVTFMRNSTSTDTTSATQTFTANGTSNCGTFSAKGWSKTGYTLKGWSEDRNATSAYYSTLSGVASSWVIAKAPSITLYGVWKDEEAPTISNKGYSNVGCNSFKVYANFSDSGSGMQKIKWQVREQNNQTILKDSNEISCTSNQKMEYAFSGLKANTTYVINIFAWDKAGNRQYSYTTVTTLEAICERVGDGQQYPSVQNGIDWNTSATLKLLKNHTESAVVNNGKDITFDPGGYTLTGTNRNFSGTMWDIALTNYGALTLTGSGTISSSGATNSYAIWQSSGKPFKMNGAKISGKTNETLVHIASGTAEFTGGNIVLENNTENNINGNAIFASGTGSFEIATGSIIQGRNGGSSSLVKSSSASECKITGGYVGKFENTTGSLVYNAGSGKLSISGGKFDMFGLGSGIVNDTGALNISGGTINLEVKKSGASVLDKGSVGAVFNDYAGTVNISGGTIKANSSIGVVNARNGKIYISGGTITNSSAYSGANDIKGATIGITTTTNYDVAGSVTVSGTAKISNTGTGVGVYASKVRYIVFEWRKNFK